MEKTWIYIFLKVLTEKRNNEELNQLIDMGACGNNSHNAFKHGEKDLYWQLKKPTLWAKYSMKYLEGVRLQNCYWHYGEGLLHGICYSQVGGKWCGCEKSKADMTNNYWSSSSLSTVTQKQTALARKTFSQHQLWSFMQGCERLSCASQTSFFRGSNQKIKWYSGSFPNWRVYGTISYGNIGRPH